MIFKNNSDNIYQKILNRLHSLSEKREMPALKLIGNSVYVNLLLFKMSKDKEKKFISTFSSQIKIKRVRPIVCVTKKKIRQPDKFAQGHALKCVTEPKIEIRYSGLLNFLLYSNLFH